MSERIPLSEATLDQIAHFGATVLGIEPDRRWSRDTWLAKYGDVGFSGETIPAAFAAPAPEPRSAPGASHRRVRPGDEGKPAEEQRWETCIRIQTTSEPGGEDPVPVSVNGRCMYIPRGQDVWVPDEYVHVLENAEMVVYDAITVGGKLNGDMRKRVVKSYPFSLGSPASAVDRTTIKSVVAA